MVGKHVGIGLVKSVSHWDLIQALIDCRHSRQPVKVLMSNLMVMVGLLHTSNSHMNSYNSRNSKCCNNRRMHKAL